MAQCSRCGTWLRDGARFCDRCGWAVTEDSTAPFPPGGAQPVTSHRVAGTVGSRDDRTDEEILAQSLPRNSGTIRPGSGENWIVDTLNRAILILVIAGIAAFIVLTTLTWFIYH